MLTKELDSLRMGIQALGIMHHKVPMNFYNRGNVAGSCFARGLASLLIMC